MIARLKDTPRPWWRGTSPRFLLPSPERALAPPLLRFEKTDVGYGGPPVLRNLNLRIDPDDRIGLLGVNGSGKSTFAKLLAQDLEPSAGEVKRHRGLRVGWFHQHQIEAMDAADTPLTIIRRVLPDASEAQRRSRLAQFGMTAQKVETTVGNLSGGERARLLLNLVAMQKPHLLILDEPTGNHLDIDSRAQLAEALNDYEGAVLLIAHDRSMMETVVEKAGCGSPAAGRSSRSTATWTTTKPRRSPPPGDRGGARRKPVGSRWGWSGPWSPASRLSKRCPGAPRDLVDEALDEGGGDRTAVAGPDVLHIGDMALDMLLVLRRQRHPPQNVAGSLDAARRLSARLSSLLNRPPMSFPSETMIAPVNVARSTMNLGLKRCWQYQIASARTRRPSASVLITSTV